MAPKKPKATPKATANKAVNRQFGLVAAAKGDPGAIKYGNKFFRKTTTKDLPSLMSKTTGGAVAGSTGVTPYSVGGQRFLFNQGTGGFKATGKKSDIGMGGRATGAPAYNASAPATPAAPRKRRAKGKGRKARRLI